MRGVPAIPAIGAVIVPVALLAVVGAASWARTASLRHAQGLPVATDEAVMDARTSALTLVPGFAGLLTVAAALMGTSSEIIRRRGPPAGWVALAAAGAAVAALGFGARVVRLHADDQGLRVEYGWSRPFSLRWEDCSLLAPPRWLMGAWRVAGTVGDREVACRLMPTDLLGHEFVLGVVAARAGLVFDGRAWTAPARDGST